jgi:DNA-binding transcriptional ArsR family regulator
VAANLDEAIRALGDPTRRAIFELVAQEPMPVGAIAARLPVSRSAVSQHLKVLKEARLVVDRPAGTRRYYEVDPDGVDALRSYFERFWNTALWSFKNAAEVAAKKEEK